MSRPTGVEAAEADEQARELARTEFRLPLVLEAGAGTGKTTALVSRIVFWLLGEGWERAAARAAESSPATAPPPPDRIAARAVSGVVAITFTEAAAAEMAKRVAAALRAIAQGAPLPPGLEPGPRDGSSPWRQPAAWAERARPLHDALDQLVVRTIHAFCRRLLASSPIEAGLHPRFEVDADLAVRDEVVRECVEARLREAYGGGAETPWLELARRGVGPSRLEEALRELAEHGVPSDVLADDPLDAKHVRSLRDALLTRLARLRDLDGGRLANVRGAPAVNATAELVFETLALLENVGPDDRASFAAFVGRTRERWAGRAGKLDEWARKGFGQRGDAALGADVPEARTAAQQLAPVIRHLVTLDVEALTLAFRALHPLLADVERELRARGAVPFSGLLSGARDLLARHPEVADRVRSQIDQLLVDEFQDTDRLQCDLIEILALEGPEHERPGLFVVGDPKQSIYGWRNADLAAYDDFVERVEAAGGRRDSLCVNHRSVPAVLDEVERVIEPLMLRRRGLQPGFQRLVPDVARAADRGFEAGCHAPVEHWISCGVDRAGVVDGRTRSHEAHAIDAEALARDLVSLHVDHGVAWRGMAVLVRGLSSADVYLGALREAGVPYDVSGDRSYFERREIIDATALVRCVLDPDDQLALLAHLRSAIVGVPDVALAGLWTPGFLAEVRRLRDLDPQRLERIERSIAAAAAAVDPDVPGLDRIRGWEASLRAAVHRIAALRVSFEQEPVDVFVRKVRERSLIEATEGARYLGAYRVANLERFFRELTEALCTGEDVRSILRRLRKSVLDRPDAEEGRPREAERDAVTFTTIHRAKGLDFDHVYLVDLHRAAPRGPVGENHCVFRGGAWELRLLGAASLGYYGPETERQEIEEAERVRTLYVAMTRARERLVLAGLRTAFARTALDGSHARLLDARTGSPDLAALADRLSTSGGPGFADEGGARWALSARAKGLEARVVPSEDELLPTPAKVAAESALLARLRAEAALYAARPFRAAASALGHDALREALETDATDERAPAVRADTSAAAVARAVGTAVHRALEEIDLAVPEDEELGRLGAVMQGILAGLLAPPEVAPAAESASLVLDDLRRGPLLARLREIGANIVARELPVLLPAPEARGPVGFVAGAVDLVYRDAANGRIVVADYKTDRVDGASALAEKRAAYAHQGRAYVSAVRDALALPYEPRFELWFLRAGRIEAVPTAGSAR